MGREIIKSVLLSAIIFIALGIGSGYLIFNLLDADVDVPGEDILPEDITTPTFYEDDVFVSTSGFDSPTNGDLNSPFRTINYSITQATLKGSSRVIVETGNYYESVILADGISVLGGYSTDFKYQ